MDAVYALVDVPDIGLNRTSKASRPAAAIKGLSEKMIVLSVARLELYLRHNDVDEQAWRDNE